MGAEHLDEHGWERLHQALRAGDPDGHVRDAWVAKEHVRDIYLTSDPVEAETALERAIDGTEQGIDREPLRDEEVRPRDTLEVSTCFERDIDEVQNGVGVQQPGGSRRELWRNPLCHKGFRPCSVGTSGW